MNTNCCSKCFARQGTSAGGGTYCLFPICPCHQTVSPAKEEHICSYPDCLHHGVSHAKPEPHTQEDWEKEFNRKFDLDEYGSSQIVQHLVIDFIHQTLQAQKQTILNEIEIWNDKLSNAKVADEYRLGANDVLETLSERIKNI
jgi:hypothetical protein